MSGDLPFGEARESLLLSYLTVCSGSNCDRRPSNRSRSDSTVAERREAVGKDEAPKAAGRSVDWISSSRASAWHRRSCSTRWRAQAIVEPHAGERPEPRRRDDVKHSDKPSIGRRTSFSTGGAHLRVLRSRCATENPDKRNICRAEVSRRLRWRVSSRSLTPSEPRIRSGLS